MLNSTKAKLLFALTGAVMGGLLVGAFFFLRLLGAQHHYREIETFFRGYVGEKEVVGISYFDFHGFRIMEYNQWKIELRDPQRESIIIYQSRPGFQESIPHQPKIEIKGGHILIDDGENDLNIAVNK